MLTFAQRAPAAQQSRTRTPWSPNRAHSPAARGIQTKLIVNTPGDQLEQEADRVADYVIRMSDAAPSVHSAPAVIQRTCAECQEDDRTPAQSVPGKEEEYPPPDQRVVFRKAAFTAADTSAGTAPPIADRLRARQGSGERLPVSICRSMENALGYDFSRVRVHRDSEAGDMSRRINALAFTHGRDVYFGSGMYNPDGAVGRRLLAHELTHVVQQGQAERPGTAGPAAPPIAEHPRPASEIQRLADFVSSPAHEVNNLASAVVNGTAAGVTWPTLNGTTFWSRAAVRPLLNRPTLKFTQLPNGTVNAEVDTLPADNIGSFDETVLSAGPWSTVAPKATIGAQHPSLAQCAGAGDSTFSAIGDPSDAEMFAANRRHEDRHATDHEAAFNASVKPWDDKLFFAFVLGTTFNGATQAAAAAALHAAMGGTPDQIADKYMDGCAAGVVAYHGTAAGGPIGAPTSPTANADCSTSSATYTNPS
jgi:hypothetical protein